MIQYVAELDQCIGWYNKIADVSYWQNSTDIQGVSQLLKQSDWAQIQDFKWYHNDDYIYWKVKR